MVELALLMIVLVPMILYTLFLSDLLLYNLDWQEAVTSPAWDAAPLDFPSLSRPVEAAARVQAIDRKVFCDHSSAYDSFNTAVDCADDRHHQALGAHQCWMGGGKQVTCGVNPGLGNVEQSYNHRFNRGGLLSCTARLGVQNYLIVQKFLSWGQDLTRTRKFEGTDVHGNASSASTSNAWVFGAQGSGASSPSEIEGEPGTSQTETEDLPSGTTRSDDFFAVLHDPWALNHLATILPDDGQREAHPFYARVEHYYYSQSPVPEERPGVDGAETYAGKLQAMGALGPTANTEQNEDAMGDLPLVPNLAFKAAKDIDGVLGFVKQPGGGRMISMGPCFSHGCRFDAPPVPPPDLGLIPPDPDNPKGGEIPGGGGPPTPVGAPPTAHATSGATPAMTAAANAPSPPPAPTSAPPRSPF